MYESNSKKYYLPFRTNYDKLNSFYHQLNDFRNLVPRAERTKIKKKSVLKNAGNLSI